MKTESSLNIEELQPQNSSETNKIDNKIDNNLANLKKAETEDKKLIITEKPQVKPKIAKLKTKNVKKDKNLEQVKNLINDIQSILVEEPVTNENNESHMNTQTHNPIEKNESHYMTQSNNSMRKS